MKHKVSELTGVLLDAAVAKAQQYQDIPIERFNGVRNDDIDSPVFNLRLRSGEKYSPSTLFAHGGPIIERENITITSNFDHGWTALCGCPADKVMDGPTPLIAAMRAFVASRFGEEVEL